MAGKVTPCRERTKEIMFGYVFCCCQVHTSDSPIKIRHAIKASVLYRAAHGVNRLKIPVSAIPKPKMYLPPPNFLARNAPGICVTVYPQKNEPKMIPWVLLSQSNSPFCNFISNLFSLNLINAKEATDFSNYKTCWRWADGVFDWTEIWSRNWSRAGIDVWRERRIHAHHTNDSYGEIDSHHVHNSQTEKSH